MTSIWKGEAVKLVECLEKKESEKGHKIVCPLFHITYFFATRVLKKIMLWLKRTLPGVLPWGKGENILCSPSTP